jgi:hypothetical protein
MTKKPELVLVQHYITTTRRLEKRSIKITISKKHCKSCSKNRKTSNLQNTNETNRPNKKWKTILCHSLSSHVCYCYQKINTS